VAEIYHHGVDLITHCNGDAAADQLIEAVRYAKKKYPNNPHVPRIIMIHAQTVTESQLD
jgi:predicted amidohydrolase YtcJ